MHGAAAIRSHELTIPDPNSSKLPGSGVEPPELEEPRMVNDSEGMLPTLLSDASEGQPGDVQPAPLFSSQ